MILSRPSVTDRRAEDSLSSHRDIDADAGQTSNFSDGICIDFE